MLPTVKRARGYRVYGANGTRYIDFYLNGGRAITGHRPNGALQVLKSTAERGLWAEYPGSWRRKADQLLLKLFPEVDRIAYFPTIDGALSALGAVFGQPVSIADTPFGFNPADAPEKRHMVVLRRPWALTGDQKEQLEAGAYGPYFIPLIPFPGQFLPVPLCRLRGAVATGRPGSPAGGPSVSEPAEPQEISPVLFHLLVKSIGEFQHILQQDFTRQWGRFDLPGLERFGPYLKFELAAQEYHRLYRRMLQQGVLLPPDRRIPAVIPFEFTEGEVMPLIRGCKERAWKR
jgi:hypothetical protein